MRTRKRKGRGSGRRGENGHKRVAEMERGAVEQGEGQVRLTSTFPLVSRGISCYTDVTTPVGVIPRGVAGPVVVDSHAHSRILRCQDLECLWLLDSSKYFCLFSSVLRWILDCL